MTILVKPMAFSQVANACVLSVNKATFPTLHETRVPLAQVCTVIPVLLRASVATSQSFCLGAEICTNVDLQIQPLMQLHSAAELVLSVKRVLSAIKEACVHFVELENRSQQRGADAPNAASAKPKL